MIHSLGNSRAVTDSNYEYNDPYDDTVVTNFLQGGMHSVVNNVVGVYSMVTNIKGTASSIYQMSSVMVDRANNWNMPSTFVQKLGYEIGGLAYDAGADYANRFTEADANGRAYMLGDIGGEIALDVASGYAAVKAVNKLSDMDRDTIIYVF